MPDKIDVLLIAYYTLPKPCCKLPYPSRVELGTGGTIATCKACGKKWYLKVTRVHDENRRNFHHKEWRRLHWYNLRLRWRVFRASESRVIET